MPKIARGWTGRRCRAWRRGTGFQNRKGAVALDSRTEKALDSKD